MTPLGREIRDVIAAEGPITVERFMALALGHPRLGYYMTRDPLGAAGDFTTAPEISQMFGELLGLWAAEVWAQMGRPATLNLVELGPGRGTLMADALRAARIVPGFRDAVQVRLVETSPVLRHVQQRSLGELGPEAAWYRSADEVPAGPAIVLANEFFDALPIRQVVRGDKGWHERMVRLGKAGELTFGLAANPDPDLSFPGIQGEIREVPQTGLLVAAGLATRLCRQGGAALVIDYGHLRTAPGETLQAVRRHAFTGVLDAPGEADLTAHVDFAALARAARRAGALVHGPATQGAFLRALGIAARADSLQRGTGPDQANAVRAALERLTGSGAGEMGALFKVLGFSHPDLMHLPGLPAPAGAGVDDTAALEESC